MGIKSLFNLKRGKNTNPLASPMTKSSSAQQKNPSETTISSYNTADSTSPNTHSNSTSLSSNASLSNSTIYKNIVNYSNDPRVPKEMIPIITLLNCQNARIYHQGQVYLNVEHNYISPTAQDLSYTQTDALIRGHQLIVYKEGLESQFKPITIDLLDTSIKIEQSETSFIIINSHNSAYHIRLISTLDLQTWISAINLSKFEYKKFNEAYTASLLSSKGPALSDLHVVLSATKYQTEEWCSIKFGKKGKWINCYAVITPSDKNKDKNGSILFYSSNRTTKKNLVCSIDHIESCYAVYPHISLIDESTLIKVNGDVVAYNLDSDFKPPSRVVSVNSSPVERSRSGSIKNSPVKPRSRSDSTSSFGNIKRMSSMSSLNSKIVQSETIRNSSLYIFPKPHNGVKSFETLIRFLIPLYDSFKLYGRPKRLIADKFDVNSLLFGLPSLPHVEILTSKTCLNLIQDNWDEISNFESLENNSGIPFKFNDLFNSQIENFFKRDLKHQGFGDLKTTLLKDVQFQDPSIKFNNFNIPEFESDPSTPISAQYSFPVDSITPPQSQQQYQGKIQNIIRSNSNYKLSQFTNNVNSSLTTPRERSNSFATNNDSQPNYITTNTGGGHVYGYASKSSSSQNLNPNGQNQKLSQHVYRLSTSSSQSNSPLAQAAAQLASSGRTDSRSGSISTGTGTGAGAGTGTGIGYYR